MVQERFFTIDAHCHVFPDTISDRAVKSICGFYGLGAAGDGTMSGLKTIGKKAGVDHFVIQSVATNPKQVKVINEFIAQTVEKNKNIATGLGTLHPESTDIKGDIEHLIELGLHGVKLHPDIQQFKIDDYRCLKIYELCEEKNLPILMHTGDSRYDFSNPNRLLPVMQIFTELTVVGAHLGGWSVWEDAKNQLVGLPNLYVDCSSSFAFMDKSRAEQLIRAYGTDRVLFGTDYPLWNASKELDILLSMDFTDDEKRLILSENAKKVYKINIDG